MLVYLSEDVGSLKIKGYKKFSLHIVFVTLCSMGTIASRQKIIEPVHEIYNNVVCVTSKALDQPGHTCSLIRAFASRLCIL